MDVGVIDYWANSGNSYLHRASALSKMLFVGLILGAVIVANNFYVLLTIYLTLASLLNLSRLPLVRVLAIAAYPAIFAALFAISRWDGTWVTPATILMKAVTAAAGAIILISTTPYPSVFAVFGRFLPRIISDGLFMTYRSFFLLLELMGHLLRALRLRGGLAPGHYLRNGANVAAALGVLFVKSLELSQRLYDVMAVRGYQGHLAAGEGWWRWSRRDWLPIGSGLSLLAISLVMRFYRPLLGYNGYLLVGAGLLLLATILVRRWGDACGRDNTG